MENAKKFYEALARDTAMQERAKKLIDEKQKQANDEAAQAAIVNFAAKEGYSCTAAELMDYSRELSEDSLSEVAGGKPTYYYLGINPHRQGPYKRPDNPIFEPFL
jgi:predicted ribosomally synthesized peptide with nif11-like leader